MASTVMLLPFVIGIAAQDVPSPVVIPLSGLWYVGFLSLPETQLILKRDGIDGPWSTFNISTYSRGVTRRNRVLPVFSQSFVSLPLEYGCPQNQYQEQKSSQYNSRYTGWHNFTGWSNCTTSRGGIYQVAGADNYEDHVGVYTYRKLVPLAMNVTGTYVRGQAGLTDSSLTNQVIGQYASPALWLGLMGINPIAFSSNVPPSYPETPAGPTFFESQASLDHIASRSWAYTAGAVNSKISFS